MVDNRLIINQPLQPTRKAADQQQKADRKRKADQASFKQVLTEKIGLKFSKHAKNRLVSRGIQVSSKDLEKLGKGVEKAADKGARDSLIMVNRVAYVVSVENKTVITAIDDKNIRENVFTNIDSAVFM